jgi:hypothetical protein
MPNRSYMGSAGTSPNPHHHTGSRPHQGRPGGRHASSPSAATSAAAAPPAPPAFLHLHVRADPRTVLRVRSSCVTSVVLMPEPAAPSCGTRPSGRQQQRRGSPPIAGRAPRFICDAVAAGRPCDLGAACPDVHANLGDATVLTPHVMPAPDDDPATYRDAPRLGEAGQAVWIAAPNEARATRCVDAGRCFATRALSVWRDTTVPVSACGHFERKGVCDFGADCQFVHALPTVAPAESALHPRRDAHHRAPHWEAPSPGGSGAIATKNAAAATRPSTNLRGEPRPHCRDPTPDDGHGVTSPTRPAMRVRADVSDDGARHRGVAAGRFPPQPGRFQHDPYIARGWI